jgi:hypothetical protein
VDSPKRASARVATSKAHARWFLGCPLAGKTLLASIQFEQKIAERRVPGIIIDSEGADNFARVRHARSVRELLDSCFNRGETLAYVPEDEDGSEVAEIANACRFPGGVVLFVDEAAHWLSPGCGARKPMMRLLRTCRHRGTDVYLTTQHLSGDVPAAALSLAPELFVFNTTSWPALERLEHQYRLDPAAIQALPALHYVHVVSGFFR